nr:MAG TPA: hypothetical protein [Caudoviricetes sp.]
MKFAFQGRCDLLRVKFVAVPNRLGKIPYICVLIQIFHIWKVVLRYSESI